MLTKSCRTGVKPRQFFLFNDILVYGSILVRGLRYSRQHILPLQEVSVRMLGEGEGEVDHGWVINTRTKSFTVYAATRGEKMGWIEAINKVTQHLEVRYLSDIMSEYHQAAGEVRQVSVQGVCPGDAAQQDCGRLHELPHGVWVSVM